MTQSSGEIIAITVVFTALAIVSVLLRSRARSITKQPHLVDDYLAYAALITLIGFITIPLLILCVRGNEGNHAKVLPDGQRERPSYIYNVYAFVIETACWVPLGLAKCSILLLYRRIFRISLKGWIVWTLIGLIISWVITFAVVSILQCRPIALYMRHPEDFGRFICLSPGAVFISGGVTDVILDAAILAIPGPMIVKLQMPMKKKAPVLAVFLLGALTLAASLTRLGEFVHITRIFATVEDDQTYYVAPTIYWTLIEAALSVIAVCLPCLMPIFRREYWPGAIRSIQSALSLRSKAGSVRSTSPDISPFSSRHKITVERTTYVVSEGRDHESERNFMVA